MQLNTNNETLREKINEDFLCILKKNKSTSQIEVDYVKIQKPLKSIIDNFSALCNNPNTKLIHIIRFINNTPQLDQLTNTYNYCVYLSGTFEGVIADNKGTLKIIAERRKEIRVNCKIDPNNFDKELAIAEFRSELRDQYILWHSAYSLNITYQNYQNKLNVLAYSHRMVGWSNPVYQLTENFSVEIKTNFGYV